MALDKINANASGKFTRPKSNELILRLGVCSGTLKLNLSENTVKSFYRRNSLRQPAIEDVTNPNRCKFCEKKYGSNSKTKA